MKAVIAAVALGFGLAAASPVLAADALLGKLVGDWTGRGTMKLKPNSEPEQVYCKITNTLAEDGKTLQQSGRCALTSTSGRIDGTITAEGGGRYSGTLSSLASKGPATLSGKSTAGRIDLDANFVDSLTGQPTTSVTTIEIASDGYRLSSSRINPADGKPYTASSITFTKS